VEFDDVRVTDGEGRVLLAEDFSDADRLAAWNANRGSWRVEDGVLRQTSEAEDVRLYFSQGYDWKDYTLSLRARKIGGAEGMLVGFAVEGYDDFYWWNIGGWNNTMTAVERSMGGVKSFAGDVSDRTVETGVWHEIRIEIRDGAVSCFLNGELVHQWELKKRPQWFASATYDEEGKRTFVKVVHVSDREQTARIRLSGAGPIRADGTGIVLTGAPQEENTLDEPDRVIPRTFRADTFGETFEWTFPPNSVTVLVLEER
jgi:alpha-L-arabinofuranosidase